MTTTTSRFVCPKCGTIKKSAKASCCGRGGSWFRNCGSAGNRKFPHTWSEGVLTCKSRTRLKVVRPRQPNGVKQLNSSYGIGMTNPEAVITSAETFIFTLDKMSTPTSTVKGSTTTPDNFFTNYNIGTANSYSITTSDNNSNSVIHTSFHTPMTIIPTAIIIIIVSLV